MKKSLKELREERGLTLDYMAERLNYSSRSGYAALEANDPGKIPVRKLLEIADAFGVEFAELSAFLFDHEVQEL